MRNLTFLVELRDEMGRSLGTRCLSIDRHDIHDACQTIDYCDDPLMAMASKYVSTPSHITFTKEQRERAADDVSRIARAMMMEIFESIDLVNGYPTNGAS